VEDSGLEKLDTAHVLIVGLGGVGGWCCEALARAGVGRMTIVDGDKVDITNVNRQLPALHSTIDIAKVDVMAARLKDINPTIRLNVIERFLEPDGADSLLDSGDYTHVVDAIDSFSPKIALLIACKKRSALNGLKVISSMGAGGRKDPQRIKIVDLFNTYNDTFAMQLRKRLRRAGIREEIPCVWSDEPAERGSLALTESARYKKSYFGTISYLPAAMGLTIASYVVRDILGETSLVRDPPPRVASTDARDGRRGKPKEFSKARVPKRVPNTRMSLEEALSQGNGFEGEGI
jgi:tRNA A37 threonylcarbamoyladenosine dehydratase